MNAHRLARLGVMTLVLASTAALAGCSFDPFEEDAPAEPTADLVRAGRPLTQAETKLAVPLGAAAPSGYAAEPSNVLEPTRPTPTRSGRRAVMRCTAGSTSIT